MAESYSPFEVPEDRRHLRHAFYVRHPELDQRGPRCRELDAAAYAAHRESERAAAPSPPDYLPLSARDPRGRPAELDPPTFGPKRLADVVRDFLAGCATLDALRDALDEVEDGGDRD